MLLLSIILLAISVDGERVTKTFVAGRDATLVCNYSELDRGVVSLMKWYFKEQRLRAGSLKYEYGEDSTGAHILKIKNVQKMDKGLYKCRPKLSIKGITVEDGEFKVVVTEPTYTLPTPPEASTLELTEGGSGQINCNFNEAREKYGLELFWTFNDERFMDETMVHENSDVTHNTRTDDRGRDWLELHPTDLGAAGEYKCNYEYPDGQVFSMTFEIRVREAVGPADVVRDMRFREDFKSATLICDLSALSGVEIVRFHWEKDGEEIDDEGSKYNMTEHDHIDQRSDISDQRRLVINDLNKDTDDGIYRCVAELSYYPIAVRFNVVIEKSTKDQDFTEWTAFSVCDKQGNRFRFRACTNSNCIDRYGIVYEVDTDTCIDENNELL